ncbi:MAG: ABC transporter permease, partial [Armatimonadota bacterium]
MSFMRLILRSLAYYHRTAAVVVVGLAIATAVIVGSLVSGDSIEGSIRHTALARLGQIHDAVTAPGFFRSELANQTVEWGAATPLVLLDGSARAEGDDAVYADVSVIGASEDLWRLYPDHDAPPLEPGSSIINKALASAAEVGPGDTLLVKVSRPDEAMTDTLFARRERDETLTTLRVTVKDVLPDLGSGGFRLDPSTAMPRNVFVDREWLAKQIGEEGGANTIVAAGWRTASPSKKLQPTADMSRAKLLRPLQQEMLKSYMTLVDYGLYLREHGEWLSLFSEAVVLSEQQVEAAEAAADRETRPTSVYLADAIAAADDPSRVIAYAVVTDAYSQVFQDGQLALNAWAAEDLGAQIGERFTVTWRASTPSGYEDHSAELQLASIVPMEGLGADPDLVPDFEGITDARHIDDWDPPFPVDLSLVTDRDDEYWERHRAAPKAFVSSALLRRMWRGDAGEGPWITSVRVEMPERAGARAQYQQALLRTLEPEHAGMRITPVRDQAIAASKGTSDFGQLFLGMSFFLVLAGAGLAGMLMRLSAERRASQAGIMMATGFTARQSGGAIAAEG